jgi:dGTPase
MDWAKLMSAKRMGSDSPESTRPGRTEYESDVDRIIFSGAFRRLGRKTQVHPLAANDHVHTRLTHSLEVSRVGYALGKALGQKLRSPGESPADRLPPEIEPSDLGAVVQAACLAHDLGNPPFGHAGEDAIINWFEQNPEHLFDHFSDDYKNDLIKVEGNAQGFRIITQLENHIFNGGLRLTYATLGAFQKYPWTSRLREKKFGAYISEEPTLDDVFSHLGIAKGPKGLWARHPLAFLVEAADDICYGIIDIEDAVEIGILSFDEASKTLLSVLDSDQKTIVVDSFRNKSHRVNFARMRGRVFDAAISGAIEAFIENYDEIMEGKCNKELFKLLEESDPRRNLIKESKELGQSSIYNDTKKVEIEIGCYTTFDTLLKEFCNAALNQSKVLNDQKLEHKLSWKSGRVLSLLGDHAPRSDNAPPGGWTNYQCLRRVIDYVSGMTDNYAVYIAKQMQGGSFSGGQRP